MAKKKTNAELQSELRSLRSARRAESFISVGNHLIKWGGLVWISYYAYLAVEAIAGKITVAEVGVSLLSKIEITVFLAWAFGVFGIWYGWSQRNLRRMTIERLQTRIVYLETIIDPGRSSSKLTPRGETRPEDRL